MSSERVCLITGIGHIGKAIAAAFVAKGYTVIGADLNPCDLPGVSFFHLDQSAPESILELEDVIRRKYGRLDVLINNAALGGHMQPLHEKPLKELDDLLAVNIRGPFLLSQSAIRIMLESATKGVIINIASTAASRATSGASVYCLSKSAVVSLTRSICAEYAKNGIRAVTISPGIMDLPNIQGISADLRQDLIAKIPSKRAGLPIEVANLAVFLASDDASYINGSEHKIEGGMHTV